MVNSALLGVIKAIFPQYCILCSLPSHREVPLCRACEQDLPANDRACERCALPLSGTVQGSAPPAPLVCGACQVSPPPFTHALAPWLYSDQLAYILQRWKYARDWRLTSLLAYLWQREATHYPVPDVLVPVPLHWRKRWRRGANQAELLCRQLQGAGITTPVNSQLVRRNRPTTAQSQLDAGLRRTNLAGAFTVKGRCDNLTIAIVDDVLTTGATASALAEALLDAGASRVDVWCLARTPPSTSARP
ncbi:MAG: double zinc ribbon domain-containing protein [Halioglobus sp.]